MIITIDGPCASGKSTVACAIAQKLDYYYINSGYLYRALAYIFLENNFNLEQLEYITTELVTEYINPLEYIYTTEHILQIYYKDKLINTFLKDLSIEHTASIIGKNQAIRTALTCYQQQLANSRNIIAEGRDAGTVVFPYADYKFFLTACIQIRAQRWQIYQKSKNKEFSLEQSLEFIITRDNRDTTRAIAPLIPACDALIIDTSEYTLEQVIIILIACIQ